MTKLLLLTLACGAALSTPAHATPLDDARVKLAALPGFKLLTNLNVAVDGSGFSVTGLPADLKGWIWKSDVGWHGALVLGKPEGFAFDRVADLGTITASRAVLVVSDAGGTIPKGMVPPGLASGLAPYLQSDALAVTAGANVLVTATPGTTGVLGQLATGLGMNKGVVVIRGNVGEDLIARVLTKQGATLASTPPDAALALSITLPPLVAPAFAALATTERSKIDIALPKTILTVATNGSAVQFGGSVVADVKAFGKTAQVTAAMTIVKTATSSEIAIAGSLATTIDRLAGIPNLKLTSLGIDAKFVTPGTSAALAVTAGLEAGAIKTTARGALVLRGTTVHEISLGLTGSFPVSVAGQQVVIKDPKIGWLPASSEGYVAGTTEWRKRAVTAVLVGRSSPVGVSLFLKTTNIALQDLLAANKLPQVTFPSAIAVFSTVPIASVSVAQLPTPVADMLASIGTATDGKLEATAGMTILAKYAVDPRLAAIGVPSTMTLGGSVGNTDGRPTMALYADLPPGALAAINATKPPVALNSARFFMALDPQSLQVGLDGELALALDTKPVGITGRLYVAIGATTGLAVGGALSTDWVTPLGLAGVTITKTTGVAMTLGADGSAKLMVNGGAKFDDLTFGLGGGIALLFSTGIPVVKGVAFRFTATEVGPTTPIKLAQTMIRATATSLKGVPLDATVKAALAKAAAVDLVALGAKALPQTRLAQQGAGIAFRDVALFLATPGMDGGAEFPQFNDVGLAVKGTLKLGATSLGAVDGFLTTNRGFRLATSVADFAIGAFGMRGAMLDTGFGIPGLQPEPPRFIAKGQALAGGMTLAAVDVTVSPDKIELAGEVNVFAAKVKLAGRLESDKSFSLTGSGKLQLSKIGDVNFPEADASFTLASSGLSLGFSAKWEKATFAVTGSYKSTSDFRLTATAKADAGTKSFYIDKHKVASVTVTSDDGLKIVLTPNSSKITFDGAATFKALPIGPFSLVTIPVEYKSKELSANLRISKTFTVWDPIQWKPVDFTATYRVFP